MEQLQRIFGDEFKRSQGNQARRYNLLAARLIADLVKSFLGPRGMAKMFVDVLGETTITKDGATFLRKIDVEHPAAKVMIEASNAVDNAVGDGTTSVIVLAGGLVKKADELLVSGIPPIVIAEGYSQALEISLDFLRRLSQKTSNSNRQILADIANTCLNSKLVHLSGIPESAVNIVVDAIVTISDFQNNSVEIDNIKIEEKIGNPSDTRLVRGIVIDKTIDSSVMPRAIRNAKILLIDAELENKLTKGDAEVRVDSHRDLQAFLLGMSDKLKHMIQGIIESGANVVISRKGISLLAQSMLAQSNIISLKRVKENDLLWIEKATGAKITNDLNINSISSCLGYAGIVHESLVGDDKMVFIEECINPKAVTILLRSNSKTILDEFHRSVLDSILVLQNYVVKPFIVYGGGSLEAIIANRIRKVADATRGRQQLVLEKFAIALEEIPLTIARNAGMDELNTITELRAKISKQTDAKLGWYGIDAIERKVDDMRYKMVLEPTVVKEQVLKTAVEVTSLLIRVDDVLIKKQVLNTHTHSDGTTHSHSGGNKKHDHFDRLGKQQRPMHHYY
ncbi:MAG: thermosome subunit alpha [Nitrososphaeraceae archaeon]